ncbi:hypothetical protein CCP3SC1AL1_970009 [Gammaproteobacteria bacterium]
MPRGVGSARGCGGSSSVGRGLESSPIGWSAAGSDPRDLGRKNGGHCSAGRRGKDSVSD